MATGYTVGDLEPSLAGVASDGTAPVDLSPAASVTAHIMRSDRTVISRVVVLGDQAAAPGAWTLAWVEGDLSVPGTYSVELQVEWPGMRAQTFGTSTFSVGRQLA